METKFEIFQNALPSIFAPSFNVDFIKIDESKYCVRSYMTGMFASCHLKQMIALCDSLKLSFYVRARTTENRLDCVEFVIY